MFLGEVFTLWKVKIRIMKTILAATDFSDSAQNAVEYAASMAELTEAKLILFHAYHVPIVASEVPTMMFTLNEMEKFAELLLGNVLDIVANADMTKLEGSDPEDVLYVACKQIKEHFGVE